MRYIALTLGPIVETIALGRKTAEVWAGSYMFSYFMKNVIDDLRKLDTDFIIPYVGDDTYFETIDNGVGMFHDRFIFSTSTVSIDEVETILATHKDNLATIIASAINKDEASVKAYMQQYIQTTLVELKDNFTNPIIEISKILDDVELHTPVLHSEHDYIRDFLNRDTIIKSALAKDSFGGTASFDSIPQIAAKEINLTLPTDKNETNAYKEVEKKSDFKQLYKYIAIVYADGDSLGKYIEEQSDSTQVSKNLFEFDKKAVKIIKKYQAIPIFVGGDDLLFFAPVINDGKTIFTLLNELNECFKSTLSDATTLSFGVNISYYKYPLYEALEHARDALFEKAKKYPTKEHAIKNATHISVRKHSGQSFDLTLSKHEDSEALFMALLDGVLLDTLKLPHAIQHKLEKYKKVFMAIPKEHIKPTFDNIFNKDIHKDEFKDGLDAVLALMLEIGVDEAGFKRLFSLLSIIKLLRGDRDD